MAAQPPLNGPPTLKPNEKDSDVLEALADVMQGYPKGFAFASDMQFQKEDTRSSDVTLFYKNEET